MMRPRLLQWKGLCADSEEKHELASDIDSAMVDSLKVLDPKRPIREATKRSQRLTWSTPVPRPITLQHFARAADAPVCA